MKGIYMISNLVNKKVYIGMSLDLNKRKNGHFAGLRKDRHENERLQNSFNKYGEDAFTFEILIADDNISQDELFKLEQMLIQMFETTNRDIGFNLSLGGRGNLGWKMSEKQKQQRSISYTGEGNPFFGKKHSKETLNRIMANRDWSYTQTNEYKEKMSKAMKGRKFSEEHSKNKSKAQLGGKNPSAKKVSIEGVIYDCIQDAVNVLGVKHTTIQYRLNAISETYKKWFYVK